MRVGFYESDITPPLGGFIPGYYSKMFAEDVYDRLYAKAVVIENDEELAAILSLDICEMEADMHEFITKRIEEYTGISADKVCITATHTHSGAPISNDLPIGCFADSAYKDVFYRIAADTVILAFKRLCDAECRFGTALVENVSYNRTTVRNSDETKSDETIAGVDNELAVLFFENDGLKIGAIVNYACHQDTVYPDVPGYSGDYSSELSIKLKEKYGQNFVSVFVPGACGDINHIAPDVKEPAKYDHRRIGNILADATVEAYTCSSSITGRVFSKKEEFVMPKRVIGLEEFKKEAIRYLKTDQSIMRLQNLTAYYLQNEQSAKNVFIQTIVIGDVCIFVMPGEIFTELGLTLKNKSIYKYNMVIENANCFGGYIPTKQAFDTDYDLYETSLCFDSCLTPDAGEFLVNKAIEISKQCAYNN